MRTYKFNANSRNAKWKMTPETTKTNFTKIIYPHLSYKINGILFSVRQALGRFCNEKQYCDAIEECLKKSNINYKREKIMPISFKGEKPGRNKTDFLIDDKIVLEIKAKHFITRDDYYQLRRYLNVLNIKFGILVNFRQRYVTPKRILNSSAKI